MKVSLVFVVMVAKIILSFARECYKVSETYINVLLAERRLVLVVYTIKVSVIIVGILQRYCYVLKDL